MKGATLFSFFIIGCCAASPPITTPPPKPQKCGYESCNAPKEGFINVHLVPHTHDDVGWLKTVDQYFYGSKTSIQNAGVQYILDSVIEALRKNPDRKFIYVETAFFWKWWIKQHDFVKHQVRKFVNNGQLEFIGGGWVMNDEATTNYQSTIDQLSWGLRKLNETFGECGRPKVGWQIDPFGHSREMASIFAQLGYDGLLLGRIDYQDKSFRFNMKTPEGVWRTSDSLDSNNKLFTSVMYNTYAPPPGFCFDILCGDEPIIDDKKSPDYNVEKRVNDFLAYVKNMTKVYTTENVIITMGEDFNYQDANVWFKNLDKLIYYTNELQKNGSKYNLFYSTPSCYLKAVHDAGIKRNIKWPMKADDFFPYSSDPSSFWTGYFSSRPALKRYERMGNNFLQVCKQLYALTDLGPEDWADLNVLREAMGVMQHHDAITGTEKQQVAFDYARQLSRGFDECQFISATALSKMVKKKQVENVEPVPDIPFQSCLLSNISQCDITEASDSFIVTVYNPLSRPVNQYVRFPVLGYAYNVTAPDGESIETQAIPIPKFIQNIPGRASKANYDLVFYARDIPPLGFKSYYVKAVKKGRKPKPKPSTVMEHKDIGIQISESTGLLTGVTINGVNLPVSQELLYYRGSVGDNEEAKNRSSGAYIFRPNGTEAYKIAERAEVTVYRGNLVIEVQQKFSEWAYQIIRIFAEESLVEFDWIVGPIPKDDYNGKEVISRFTTPLNSQSTFYTDLNGRETLKRVRNYRPTWKLNLTEPVSGNYYPVTSRIMIRDQEQDLEVAILTDRAQGGTSLRDGQLELMLHRLCLHDDAFGVGEALNEEAFGEGLLVRGSLYLVAGHYLKSDGVTLAAQEKDLIQRKLLSSWTFFSPTNNLPYEVYKNKYKMTYSGLQKSLPSNIQILTLEPWQGMNFLLRLEHVFEKDEDPTYSKPVTVDLSQIFAPFKVLSFKETTLGANQWLKDNNKLEFESGPELEDILGAHVHKTGDFYDIIRYNYGRKLWQSNQKESNYISIDLDWNQGQSSVDDGFSVLLNPMQIRTFVIDIKMN